MKTKVILPTSAEITQRLRTVAELRNLCLSLGRAGREGDARYEAELRGQERAKGEPENDGKDR